jgi:preprotein translocase subunit SecG
MLFNIIKVTLTVVEVIVCMLLITAVLMQKSKTQGAGLAFGSGVGETLFGGQIGNVMTKITVILTVIFLVNTTALTYMAVKAKYRRTVRVRATPEQTTGGASSTAPARGVIDPGPARSTPVE